MSKNRLVELLESKDHLFVDLLGISTLRLITSIEGMDSKRVATILVDFFGFQLITDNEKRNAILSSLSEMELRKLFQGSGVLEDIALNSFQTVKEKKNFAKVKEHLLDLFELSIPPKPPIKDEQFSYIVEPKYKLFEHQIGVLEEARDKVIFNQERALIHMPTGAGKTRTAMNLVCEYLRSKNKSVIWFADSYELCEQASEEFQKAWSILGIRDVDLVKFYSKSDINIADINKPIFMVSGVSKFHQWQENLSTTELVDFSNKIGLVIFDEAHRVLAPTYEFIVQFVIGAGSKKSLLGLSATPGRSTFDEEENKRFSEFFDKNLISLKTGDLSPIRFLQEEGYLSIPSFESIQVKAEEPLSPHQIKRLQDGADFSLDFLKKIGRDANRNLQIISVVMGLKKNDQAIVFCPSVESAKAIYFYLKLIDQKVGLVTSETDPALRARTISCYKENEINVIINYGVLTTGFDAPKTNVCIIARPTTSVSLYSQMVGRAMRGLKAKGTQYCKIYTVVDENLGFDDVDKMFEFFDSYFKKG